MLRKIVIWALPVALVTGMLILVPSCLGPAQQHSQRTGRPMVYRSVLDEKARMLSIQLDQDCWVAYRADDASLYKVWPEGVLFDGAVYTYAHGPQPTSIGPAWIANETQAHTWTLLQDGRTTLPAVLYGGHRFVGADVVLSYTLDLGKGTHITIQERPEKVAENGKWGFRRNLEISGLPEGAQLRLHTGFQSLLSPNAVESEGNWIAEESEDVIRPGLHASAVSGYWEITQNGPQALTAWLTEDPLVPAKSDIVAEESGVHPGLTLIENSDCETCHNEKLQTVGPSYEAIAERYKTTAYNLTQLSNKVMKGGYGVWGQAAMVGHPDLTQEHALQMVAYILSLDGEPPLERDPSFDFPIQSVFQPEYDQEEGLVVNAYAYEKMETMPDPGADEKPVFSGITPQIHAFGEQGFSSDKISLENHFFIRFTGAIEVQRTAKYVLRLISDDGSILYLDGAELINNDGFHDFQPREAEITLEAGTHPIRIDYMQGGGGYGISLQWVAYGEEEFSVIPSSALRANDADIMETREIPQEGSIAESGMPGDGQPVSGLHPSFELQTIHPEDFQPKVGGLDQLADGRIVLSTWDSLGAVYIVDNFEQGDRSQVTVKRIAEGLAEPLGLKVVGDELYVLQKQELTQLIDHDGDEIIDEYRTVCNGWKVSANFHEFAFGLVYQDDHFYLTLATAIMPGGASADPQIPDRGKIIKVNRETGAFEFLAHGLRTPNGIGIGVDDEIFIADNQGDWLPASKIVHVKPGAWYGSRSVDFEGTANLKETLPVVWLPQDEIGNSPSQPGILNAGPYQGQMIHGEVTHGGIKRVFVEQVNGEYQGALFRFTQGLQGGVNRIVWGQNNWLYVGEVGNPGNWSHAGREWYGLQRMRFTEAQAFEMLAVRVKPTGFEIEFTEPLAAGVGESPADYDVEMWRYVPTKNYGGPKVDPRDLSVRNVSLSEDRKTAYLQISGLERNRVVHIRLEGDWQSAQGRAPWSRECWYTLNQLPGRPVL